MHLDPVLFWKHKFERQRLLALKRQCLGLVGQGSRISEIKNRTLRRFFEEPVILRAHLARLSRIQKIH
ncbi:hypothetical protein HZH66_002559 [Vespula vulgaris]|uniref:Uncharacterized protein n=1 Tax=Vespula vulgaris TaxID=7454 RepID=A0A834KK57_VESVU|nr:hypothetical protein HZH66_002559 [Vespula vulgaris]